MAEFDALDHRDDDLMDIGDSLVDSSFQTVQCQHCGSRIKLNTHSLAVNQACSICGGVLKLGNVYDVETEELGGAGGEISLARGNRIKGGMSSLRTRNKASYLDTTTSAAAVLDDAETEEGLIEKLNTERLHKFLHPVLCFTELYQRVLLCQVDYLIQSHGCSPKLREAMAFIWIFYLQQLQMYKL
jgi:ribosomal protein S27E